MIREPAVCLSDDADQRPHYALTVYQAANGDFYLAIMPAGGKIGPVVRISTSGGASTRHPGITDACRRLWEAIAGKLPTSEGGSA